MTKAAKSPLFAFLFPEVLFDFLRHHFLSSYLNKTMKQRTVKNTTRDRAKDIISRKLRIPQNNAFLAHVTR